MTSGRLQNAGDIVGGRYEVVDYINQGGMQEVYKAHDVLLNRLVALKTPKNESATKRFKRSAVVSAKVNHANVAKTLDYVINDGRPYLIEEFIEGDDLGNIIKASFEVIDPLQVAWILHRLAKGIAASHHAGVIHRDLKPSNVMVVGGSSIVDVKITDFGIAKLAEEELEEAVRGGEESLTASQTAIGALPYMAPEMIESVRDVSQAADIWSLGALTFELLTGEKPFGAGLKAVTAIQTAPPRQVKLPAASKPQFKAAFDEISAIISSCLQKDASQRPSADALVSQCSKLCYPINSRESGTVKVLRFPTWGFISDKNGSDVFFHTDSVFAKQPVSAGDKVVFARHRGGGSDRAFPVIKIK